jgi:hypothetical protein
VPEPGRTGLGQRGQAGSEEVTADPPNSSHLMRLVIRGCRGQPEAGHQGPAGPECHHCTPVVIGTPWVSRLTTGLSDSRRRHAPARRPLPFWARQTPLASRGRPEGASVLGESPSTPWPRLGSRSKWCGRLESVKPRGRRRGRLWAVRRSQVPRMARQFKQEPAALAPQAVPSPPPTSRRRRGDTLMTPALLRGSP